MGLLEFNKLPINTLVGADWKTFNQITAGRTIDPAYKGKYRLTKAVCRLLSTLAPCRTDVTKSCWPTSRWNMIRYLSSDTGVAEPRSCTTYSPATSTSAIILPIKQYSRT